MLPQNSSVFDDLGNSCWFKQLYLSELAEENNGLNLASSVPVAPHQFAKLAETLRKSATASQFG